jgi:hypothetical protein
MTTEQSRDSTVARLQAAGLNKSAEQLRNASGDVQAAVERAKERLRDRPTSERNAEGQWSIWS